MKIKIKILITYLNKNLDIYFKIKDLIFYIYFRSKKK